MNIYAVSGLGADKRVYQQLNLNADLIHLEWITPLKNETIFLCSKTFKIN